MSDAPSPSPDPAPRKPGPPAIWPVFAAFGVVVIAMVMGGAFLLVALFVAERGGTLEDLASLGEKDLSGELATFSVSAKALLLGASVSAFSLTGAAFTASWLSKTSARARLRLGPSHLRPHELVLVALGGAALGHLLSAITTLLGIAPEGTLEAIHKAIVAMPNTMFAMTVLLIAVAAPAGEELFFRGFMLTRLSERWPKVAAIGVTALAFGVVHMDLAQGLFALAVGLYLGWITERTGSIRPAFFAHLLNNLASVLESRFLPETTPRSVDVAILVVSAIVFAAAAVLVWRLRAPAPARLPEGA